MSNFDYICMVALFAVVVVYLCFIDSKLDDILDELRKRGKQ